MISKIIEPDNSLKNVKLKASIYSWANAARARTELVEKKNSVTRIKINSL